MFKALEEMRGLKSTFIGSIQDTQIGAIPGVSFPTISIIPNTSFNCAKVRVPGMYADPEAQCQVYRRCEADNTMFSYLCPNRTVSSLCNYNLQSSNIIF